MAGIAVILGILIVFTIISSPIDPNLNKTSRKKINDTDKPIVVADDSDLVWCKKERVYKVCNSSCKCYTIWPR